MANVTKPISGTVADPGSKPEITLIQAVNQAMAYENLLSDMKNKIDGLKARHVYQSKYSTRKMPTRSKEDEALSPASRHPIARTHPVTGRKAIYLNPVRTESIEGMNERMRKLY